MWVLRSSCRRLDRVRALRVARVGALLGGLAAVVAFVLAPAATSATSGLVAAYGFDEGSGPTLRTPRAMGIRHARDATWTSREVQRRACVQRHDFAGGCSRLSLAAFDYGDDVRGVGEPVRPSTSNWRDVIYKGKDNYYLEASSTNAGKPAGAGMIGGVNTQAFGTAPLATNTWTHLATTYDGATRSPLRERDAGRDQAVTGTLATSTDPLQIGGDSIFGQYFTGIDRRGPHLQQRAYRCADPDRHELADRRGGSRIRSRRRRRDLNGDRGG